MPPALRPRDRRRRGFTFVEAMVAVTITGVAGAALLVGISASLQGTTTALEQTVALGLAQQLMDELAGKQYAENAANPYDTPLGPTSAESAGPGRSQYTNLADYNGLANAPPVDPWAVALGTDDGQGSTRDPAMKASNYLANWQRSAVVYYVDPNNLANALPAGQTSNYRAVEVQISVLDKTGLRPVLKLRRIFAYVPSS
jgi:type II secretory pathway pseudopilin PulG